jgi:hypothetical protein
MAKSKRKQNAVKNAGLRNASRSGPQSSIKGGRGPSEARSSKVVPDIFRAKLVYKQRVSMGGSAGVIVQKFRGNDLFDPDISGTGGQPYGFDQLMALYSFFRVMSSKIDVHFCSVGTAAGTQSYEAIVVPTATGVSFTTTEDASAAPYALWTLNQGLSNPHPRLTSSISTSKIEGIPESKVRDEDNYSGSAAASPTNQWDWQIITQAIDRSSNLSCFAYVSITYDVEFYARVNLALS